MPGGKRERCEVPTESATQRYAGTIRTVSAEYHFGRPVRGRAGKPQGHHAPHRPSPAPSPADAESQRCPPPQQTVVAGPGQARQNRVEERTRTGKTSEDGPVHSGNDRNQQPCPIDDQCSSDSETPRMADRVTRSHQVGAPGRHVRWCGHAASAGPSGGASRPPRPRCSPGSEAPASVRWFPPSAGSPRCRQTRSHHCTAGSIPGRSVGS